MKLNQNTITAKIYRWFYGTSQMPANLCPYFWKLVTALIFGLPFFIFTLPFTVVYRNEDRSLGERFGISTIIWIMLFFSIAMLTTFGLFWSIPEKDTFYFHMVGMGIICWLGATIIGAYHLFKYLKENLEGHLYRKRNYDENGNWIPLENRKEKTSNILVEMIKATYHKYCPKIDWK